MSDLDKSLELTERYLHTLDENGPRDKTMYDVIWERRQGLRAAILQRELGRDEISRIQRIDASSETVARRVFKAAQKGRKVVRIDELLDGVERVCVR